MGVPRALGLAGHFVIFLGLVALVLWLVLPIVFEQAQQALCRCTPRGREDDQGLLHSVREQALTSLESKLSETLPARNGAVDARSGRHPRPSSGVAFTLAAAAYWVIERDRLVKVILAVVPHEKRMTVRDTWLLIVSSPERSSARRCSSS